LFTQILFIAGIWLDIMQQKMDTRAPLFDLRAFGKPFTSGSKASFFQISYFALRAYK